MFVFIMQPLEQTEMLSISDERDDSFCRVVPYELYKLYDLGKVPELCGTL